MVPTTESKSQAGLADYLAAERTLLAWIRTGLALMGFGFVVARFGLFLQQIQAFQHSSATQSYGLSLWFGTALIAAGVAVNVFAGWHHVRLVRQLDQGDTTQSHPPTVAMTIAFFLALVGLVMVIYLISVRSSTGSKSQTVVSGMLSTSCWRGEKCSIVACWWGGRSDDAARTEQ